MPESEKSSMYLFLLFAGGSGLTETHGSHLQISPASSLFGAGRDFFHKIPSLQDIIFYKIPIFTRQQISKDSRSYKTLVSKSEGVTLSKINVGVA